MEIIYFTDDDGSYPAVSEQHLQEHKDFLTSAFADVNIVWRYNVKVIRNTTLNMAEIMLECKPASIGKLLQ